MEIINDGNWHKCKIRYLNTDNLRSCSKGDTEYIVKSNRGKKPVYEIQKYYSKKVTDTLSEKEYKKYFNRLPKSSLVDINIVDYDHPLIKFKEVSIDTLGGIIVALIFLGIGGAALFEGTTTYPVIDFIESSFSNYGIQIGITLAIVYFLLVEFVFFRHIKQVKQDKSITKWYFEDSIATKSASIFGALLLLFGLLFLAINIVWAILLLLLMISVIKWILMVIGIGASILLYLWINHIIQDKI